MTNPLQIDPSLTSGLRKEYKADVGRLFSSISSKLEPVLTASLNGISKRPQDQVAVFNSRLNQLLSGGVKASDKYMQRAYEKGISRVFYSTPGLSKSISKGAFISLVTQKNHTLQSFQNTASSDMRSVMRHVSDKLESVFRREIRRKTSKGSILSQLKFELQKIRNVRGDAVGDVNIVGAQAEGQLDAMEHLKVKYVTAKVEFTTVKPNDGKVCPICRKLNGKVFTIKKARGVIPVHVRCRCSWIVRSSNKVVGIK